MVVKETICGLGASAHLLLNTNYLILLVHQYSTWIEKRILTEFHVKTEILKLSSTYGNSIRYATVRILSVVVLSVVGHLKCIFGIPGHKTFSLLFIAFLGLCANCLFSSISSWSVLCISRRPAWALLPSDICEGKSLFFL